MTPGTSTIPLTFSCAVHGLALLLLVPVPPSTPGMGGQQLDAISVEIVRSDFAAREAAPGMRPAAASSAGSGDTGAPGDIDQKAVAEQTASSKAEPEKLPEPMSPDVNDRKPEEDAPLTTADAEPLRSPEIAVTEPPKEKPSEKPPELVRPETDEAADQVAIDPNTRGGAETMASQPSQSRLQDLPAASPGEVAAYAMSVRKALSNTRPKHTGRKGRVGIAFSIATDGALRYVKVAKSSGSDRLDQAAINSVRAAKLPTPPSGMTEAQLSYSISVDFK
jgi:TonB family protein